MSPEGIWPWTDLGLPGPADEKSVRRAYGKLVKALDQSRDAERFQSVRSAYEFALHLAREAPDDRPVHVRLPDGAELRLPAGSRVSWDADAARPPLPLRKPDPKPQDSPPQQTQPHDDAPQPGPLDTLLQLLALPDQNNDAGHRIRDALANPLADQPDSADQVQSAVRSLLLSAIRSRKAPGWPRSIDGATLRALDQKYRWFSDYKLLQDTFGYDQWLQSQLLDRVHGHVGGHYAPHEDAQRKKRHAEYIDKFAIVLSGPLATLLIYLILTVENLTDLLPDGLIHQDLLVLGTIGLLIGLAILIYLAIRPPLRQMDQRLAPLVERIQHRIGHMVLARELRITIFGVIVFVSLLATAIAGSGAGILINTMLLFVVFGAMLFLNLVMFRSRQ